MEPILTDLLSGLGLAHPAPQLSGEPGRGQGWNGLGVRAGCGCGKCSHRGQQAAVQVLGPHSQLVEGIQEVLTATQTSWSLVRGRSKPAAPRDGYVVTWLLGRPPGQEATAPQTARATTGREPRASPEGRVGKAPCEQSLLPPPSSSSESSKS